MKNTITFVLFFFSNFLAATETIPLNGDHFFLGSITPEVVKKFKLETHSKAPSLSHFYINYQRKVQLCVEYATIKRVKQVGATLKEVLEQSCRRSEWQIFPKQYIFELKRKREGQKNPKTFILNIRQNDIGSEPDASFQELNSVSQTVVSISEKRTTFDYNRRIKIFNFTRNQLNLWNPKDLIEAPYFKRINLEFTEASSEQTVSQEKFEPIVKNFEINLNSVPKNKHDPFILNIKYFTIERSCLKEATITRNNVERQECVSYGFKPQKQNHQVYLQKNPEATGEDKVSLLVAQKYINSPLKLKVSKPEETEIQSLTTRTRENRTDIDIKSTSIICL